jgi:hypothetical protein
MDRILGQTVAKKCHVGQVVLAALGEHMVVECLVPEFLGEGQWCHHTDAGRNMAEEIVELLQA